jgi:probable rRNA maturation factor
MIRCDWEILIANRQRARRLNLSFIKQLTAWLLEDALQLQRAELGIHFVTPKEMARVHEEFMNIAGSTDVITFDHGSEPPDKIHGEIFISVEDAINQANEFKTAWQHEIVRYIIHGVLHLLGYDDLKPALRAKMKREENRLLKKAAGEFSLRGLEKK